MDHQHRDGLFRKVGKVEDVGKSYIILHAFAENSLQDARKIVVTDAVANCFEAKSSFLESEGGTKQVENVLKNAHDVAGV